MNEPAIVGELHQKKGKERNKQSNKNTHTLHTAL